MNVVIYARYSSDKQREESIEGQIKVCTAFAEREGYTVVDTYIDRAMSARTDNRPQFQKMIADSKKKHFDGVLVYQLDRFARSREDSLKYKAILRKNGVKVLSANERIADGASGILLESVIEGLAEYYSAELSEKIIRGNILNAEKCLSIGGRLPLGYKVENKKYVLNEETAPIVKEVFQKYADGMSIKQIYDNLNSRGLTSSRGAVFNKNSMHTMLKNRKYLGIYIYKGEETPGGMPQIVDEDLFNKVQEKMIVNKKSPARAKAKAEYILTEKLFCGNCKEKMVGHSSNQISKKGVIFNYYKCKNSGGSKPCKKKAIQKNYIENLVIEECRRTLSPSNIRNIAKEVVKIVASYDDRAELDRLEKLLKKKQNGKTNLLTALRECDNTEVREVIFEDLAKIGEEIKALEKQIAVEKPKYRVITEKQIITSLTSLVTGDLSDNVKRKTLIRIAVNKIFLYDDRLTVTFHSGEEEFTINERLLADIENDVESDKLCILKSNVHQ